VSMTDWMGRYSLTMSTGNELLLLLVLDVLSIQIYTTDTKAGYIEA